MSLPTSLGSYLDCRALFDAAAADTKGVRACLGTEAQAVHMRTRMHQYRKLDRKANAEVYPRGDPKHGTSTYDDFVIQIKEDAAGEYWLYLQRNSSKILAIEGLSTLEENMINVEADEVHLIEDKSDATSS